MSKGIGHTPSRNRGTGPRALFATLVVLLVVLFPMQVLAWPLDGQWLPLTSGGMVIGDPDTDGNTGDYRNIVGDTANPSAYFYADGTNLFFRLRVDGNPAQGQGLRPFGWGVILDTDNDWSAYEYLIMVDGISETVRLEQNTAQGTPYDASDAPEVTLATYSTATNTQVSVAGSNFSADADYFIDWSVPWSAFSAATGLDESSQISMLFGTSNNASTLGGDIDGGTGGGSDQGSDPTYPSVADLSIAKSHAGDFTVGVDGVYTIDIANAGPSNVAGTVTVTDTLPVGLTYVSATGTGWTCGAAGQVVTCTMPGPLNAGTSAPPLTLTVAVTDAARPSVTNTATVTAETTDDNAANDTASDPTTVLPQADLAMSKVQNGIFTVGEPGTFSLGVTSAGPSPVSGTFTVTDTLAPELGFVSATGSGWSCGFAGGTVTCSYTGTLAPGGSLPDITLTVQPSAAAASGTIQNTAQVSSPAADLNAGNDSATVTVQTGWRVSGSVFSDDNHDGVQNGSEAGTGQNLWVKLVPSTAPGGPATHVALIDTLSGDASVAGVLTGTYDVLVDTNNDPSDITPDLPAGWIGTTFSPLYLSGVVVNGSGSVVNAGLYHGSRIDGIVFRDDGVGGGTANDGIANGGEVALAGRTVALTDGGGTVLESTVTDGSGAFGLWLPASAAEARLVQTNDGDDISTTASVGNTGGSYDRITDTLAFTHTPGSLYSGIAFGDVQPGVFSADDAITTMPGTTLYYPAVFMAGTAGSLTFSPSSSQSWNYTVYLDADGSGTFTAGDTAVAGPVFLNGGESAAFLLGVSVPAGASAGTVDIATWQADFTFSGLAVQTQHQVVDTTTVAEGLSITKEQSVNGGPFSDAGASAVPGDTITYRISYSNPSAVTLYNLVIQDPIPAWTAYVGATGSPSVSSGIVTWSVGTLAPGDSGTVELTVELQ